MNALSFVHIKVFLFILWLAFDGILRVHHHGDGDEEQSEDGVCGERDPEQWNAQHRCDHKLKGAGKSF